MSFRCERCQEPQPPRTRPTRVVTKWRTHPANYDRPEVREVAEEQNWCNSCVEKVIHV